MHTKSNIGPGATTMKNRVLFVVAMMIVLLSALFFYNMISYSNREIQHITRIYASLIKQHYHRSRGHANSIYTTLAKRLLTDQNIIAAATASDPHKLQQLTLDILKNSPIMEFYLEDVIWHFSHPTQKLPIYRSQENFPPPSTPDPMLAQALRLKAPCSGVFTHPGGFSYRIIIPLDSQPKTKVNPITALEFVLNPEQFLIGGEKMLGMQTVIAVKLPYGSKNCGQDLGAGYFSKSCITPCPWLPRSDFHPINPKLPTTQISIRNKIYVRFDNIIISDYCGHPAALILAALDITDLKKEINSSLNQLIPIAVGILIFVFMTLYYGFGRLMGRLVIRDKQLEFINTQLETKIHERETMENELKTHRDHLEDLIAEGTMELEIKSQEIEANEMKLRTVTSSLQDAILMVDPNGNILFWNDAAERMFQYSGAELRHKDFFNHIISVGSYKKFIETFGQSDPALKKDTYSRIFEIECTAKNQHVFPAELVISEVEIHEQSNLIVVIRDITRKKEEETQNRILLRAVEQSSVAIQIADTQGIIQYINPKFTQITGYTKEEAIGQNTNILKSNFNPQEDYQNLWETITAGKDWNGELYNRKKDGQLYWDSTLISPIKDSQGKITHFVAVKEDITERKNMEVELLTAKDAAEAASRSKGEFLANMSHEIRTPMNAIMGMTELALGTQLNEEQREYLEIVSQASRSLLKLLNDILDFSKVDAGKLILEAKPFELRKSLGDIIKTLAIQAHAKNLELIYYIDSQVPEQLIGDVGRMRQVVVNLIGNAIKFTNDGEIVLKIDVLEDGIDNKILLHFIVADTGIGIHEDQLGFVFEKFAQVDSSSTRKYGGTGLGLAISSKLVELMGGVIWAESPSTFPHSIASGPGSTFHFTALFEIGTLSSQREDKDLLDKIKGLSLLIVDDNETNRRFLQELLFREGLIPQTASSGLEALQILSNKANSFQLLILDFRMPGMDGGTLLKKIRQELHLSTPAILITSGVSTQDILEFKSYQADAHLLKPVNSQELLPVILRVLGYKIQEVQAIHPPESSLSPQLTPQLHVLVAEDNMINQRLIRRLLEKEGHHVDIASDGIEAVALFIKQVQSPHPNYNLILMDIMMPHMDGIEATTKIREIDKHIPIIALTAHAMKGDKGKFIAQGMDDYVSKPIDKKILFDTINKYVPHDLVAVL